MKGNSIDYVDLEIRVKKFKKYERIFDFLTKYWFFALWVALAIDEYFKSQFLGNILGTYRYLFSIFIAFALWIPPTYVIGKRMRKYRVEDEEWVTFYTNSILENLEKYSKTKNPEMKKDYRKKAIENAKEFLSCIKKRWKIGSFKLVRDYIRDSISDLKKNIECRVIFSLKKGDDETVGKVEQIIRNFLAESRSLSLDGINRLNEQMSSRLPTSESIKIRSRDRLRIFFEVHKILKHGLFVSGLIIGCSIFYIILVNNVGIMKEYALTVSVAIFLGLLTMYFTKKPKE